jgi:hypothetical protein
MVERRQTGDAESELTLVIVVIDNGVFERVY